MGERVTFAADGRNTEGYLARPSGAGPGVVVIHEWWGLLPHMERVTDRFAANGFGCQEDHVSSVQGGHGEEIEYCEVRAEHRQK